MANKLIIGGISAIVLVGAIYVGGVYFTGVKVSEHLQDLDNNVQKNAQIQAALPGLKVTYQEENSSLFSKTGKVHLSLPDDDGSVNEALVPLFINNGFLNTKISLDADKFDLDLNVDELLPLDKNSQKLNAYVEGSLISSKVKCVADVSAAYTDKNYGALTLNFEADIDGDENIEFNSNLKNIKSHDGNLEQAELTSKMKGFENIVDLGESRIVLKGLNAGIYNFKSMEFTSKAVNKQKDGKFDLNMSLKGDSLMGYLYDYDVEVTLASLNINDFNQDSKREEDLAKLISNLHHLEVHKLNCRPAQIVGFYTGIAEIEKLKLTSSGAFDWDVKSGFDSLKGQLVINADSNKNMERFFVEKNGKFESVIKVENNRFFVNDVPFM